MGKVKEFIIDDSTPDHKYMPTDFGRGWDGSEMGEHPYAGMQAAKPFPDELLIPEHEWQARIQEQEETQSTPKHLFQRAGGVCKNQFRTSLCWSFAAVVGVEITEIIQGRSYRKLSPASTACLITNFQNVGGWSRKFIEVSADKGICASEDWPDIDVTNRALNTTENRQKALECRPTEWYYLPPRSHKHMVSAVLRRKVVPSGYNWWGHAVCVVRLIWRNGTAVPEIINSWGEGFGVNGYGTLEGSKMYADDATTVHTITASG